MEKNNFKNPNYTNTTRFILPLLFNSDVKYEDIMDSSFVNAYIADMSKEDNDNNIHLLFEDDPSEQILEKIPNIFEKYLYKDKLTVIVSPLNIDFEDDYEKIIRGEYSKISKNSKDRILSFWKEYGNSVAYGVLYKNGNTVKEYYQEILGTIINDVWTKEKEWWIPFEITEEILGLS